MSADFNQRWHASYPELGTDPVPIEPLISPAYFALERDRIFRRVWLQVGRIEQLPEGGSYFVKDIPICQTSIVVVREKTGRSARSTTSVLTVVTSCCGVVAGRARS